MIRISSTSSQFKCKLTRQVSLVTLTTTCEASEKFGPGDRFLFGTGGVELATPPPLEPFRFRRLFAGRWASLIELS